MIYFLTFGSYALDCQMSANPFKESVLNSLGPHFEVPLTKHGEPNIHFFESTIFSRNFVLFAVHLNVALQVQ